MEHHHFGNLIADGVEGIQGGHRLLKNHGNLAAANLPDAPASGVQLGQIDNRAVFLVQKHLPFYNFARRLFDQPHNRVGGDAFATATFAHHTQRRLAAQCQIDTVDSLDSSPFKKKIGLEIFDFQQGFGGRLDRLFHRVVLDDRNQDSDSSLSARKKPRPGDMYPSRNSCFCAIRNFVLHAFGQAGVSGWLRLLLLCFNQYVSARCVRGRGRYSPHGINSAH